MGAWLAFGLVLFLSFLFERDFLEARHEPFFVLLSIAIVAAGMSALMVALSEFMTRGMSHKARIKNGVRTYRLVPGFMILTVLVTPLVALGAVQFVAPLLASTDIVTLTFAIGLSAFFLWMTMAGLDAVFLRVVLTETELKVHRIFRVPVVVRLTDLTFCDEKASEYIRLQRSDGKKIKFISWLRGGEALHAELRDIVEKNKNAGTPRG